MNSDQEKTSRFFASAQIAEIVGIDPPYLNKCIERKSYGIEASIRAGEGRGSRRFFSEDDVFGVALVWWLYESGLRLKAIEYVLNQICGRKLNSKAIDASRILLAQKPEVLAVRREPRTVNDSDRNYPKQRVFMVDPARALQLVGEAGTATLLVVPVGTLFRNLKMSMQKPDSNRSGG